MESPLTPCAVVGADGFLGSNLIRLCQEIGIPCVSTSRLSGPHQFDLSDLSASVLLADLLKNNGVKTAFICAAQPNVDACAKDPERARTINVTGTLALCRALQEQDILPVFFSSDYVFSGRRDRPDESVTLEPLTEYGRQKAETESALKESGRPHLIFRTSKIFSMKSHAKNPLQHLTREVAAGTGVFAVDQYMTPVFVEDFKVPLLAAIQGRLRGTYHLAWAHKYNRFEMASFIATRLGRDPKALKSCRLADLNLIEPRPHYSTLNADKIQRELDFRFRDLESVNLKELL